MHHNNHYVVQHYRTNKQTNVYAYKHIEKYIEHNNHNKHNNHNNNIHVSMPEHWYWLSLCSISLVIPYDKQPDFQISNNLKNVDFLHGIFIWYLMPQTPPPPHSLLERTGTLRPVVLRTLRIIFTCLNSGFLTMYTL